METREVNKIVRYWKKKLDIEDWNVAVQFECHAKSMDNTNDLGECFAEEVSKNAIIKIVKEEESESDIGYDFEQILVHEMLHIKFWWVTCDKSTLEDRLMHQTIDTLATALVNAKRGK